MEKQQSYEVVPAASPRLPHQKTHRWIPEIDKDFSDLANILAVMAMTPIYAVEMKMNWADNFHKSFKFKGNIGYFRFGLWDSTDVPEELWDSETRPERDEKAKISDIWVPFGQFENKPKSKDSIADDLDVFRMKPMVSMSGRTLKKGWEKEQDGYRHSFTLNELAERIRNREKGEWKMPVWELSDMHQVSDPNNIFEFDEKAGLWSVAEPTEESVQ